MSQHPELGLTAVQLPALWTGQDRIHWGPGAPQLWRSLNPSLQGLLRMGEGEQMEPPSPAWKRSHS